MYIYDVHDCTFMMYTTVHFDILYISNSIHCAKNPIYTNRICHKYFIPITGSIYFPELVRLLKFTCEL